MSRIKENSRRTIRPFTWEDKPGVCKAEAPSDLRATDYDDTAKFKAKLPPPPGHPEKYRSSLHDLHIPPPPCAFQPPLRSSSSKRRLKKNDDPFLRAYKECTKSSKREKWLSAVSRAADVGDGLKTMNLSVFSCKHSCSVIDDSIIKTSQLPVSKSLRDQGQDED